MYSPNGEILAVIGAGNGSWLYSIPTNTWVYTQDHDTDVFGGGFSPDSQQFATGDQRGNVVIRDLQTIFYSTTTR